MFPKPNQLTQSLPLEEKRSKEQETGSMLLFVLLFLFGIHHHVIFISGLSSNLGAHCIPATISRGFFASKVLRHQFLAEATLSEEGTHIETRIKDGTAIIFPGKHGEKREGSL